MRICIQTLGSRGDVQPFLALALELSQRGHRVQLAGPAQFHDLATSRGVGFAPLPAQFLALLDAPEAAAAMQGVRGIGAACKLLKQVQPLMRRLFDAEWQAVSAFTPDLIVYHPKSLASRHMAERLAIPAMLASPLPGFTPTSAFPSPLFPVSTLGPLNRMSHWFSMHGGDLLFGRLLGRWRREVLGLGGGRARRRPLATLYAYSPSVLPRPADWDSSVCVAGYCFLDEGHWTMPAGLDAFLGRGAAPVYVGFGSMPAIDAGALARQVIEALAMAGKRGVLATGGGALQVAQAPEHVHVIAAAPHAHLFRHVSAALHHGGAGTTAASLRAGLPTIVCPFFGDQPFWGRRVAALGAGPAPIPRRRLGSAILAAAFKAVDDPGMRRRAAAIGEQLSGECGAAEAARFIEQAVRAR
ncbi:glycosyltransferase family 1 protein [Massilia sp. UMI-21]|nr:glycosyltransferase family 1 protein [Massilia sp. UMI-21]